MKKPEVSDELWTLIEPLLPVKPRRRTHPGRRPRDARRCLAGILYVLFTGIPWEYLPREFGCCGMTCWRRLRDWQAAGVWDKVHHLVLAHLHAAHKIDWSRAVVDSSSIRAVGGRTDRPEPRGPAKTGLQTQSRHRCPGPSAGGGGELRQSLRQHNAADID